MNEPEKSIAKCTNDFVQSLPESMSSHHIGAVFCTILDAFDLQHDKRAHICESVVNAMLEADMRDEERAAQSADAVLARAAAKARK